MEYKLENMGSWERQKACFLINTAEDLEMNLESYGFVDVNNNSGYTYLWSEDYNFSLYMPINCKLKKTDIYALWSCSECGQEEDTQLKTTDELNDIEERINEIETEHIKEAHNKEE